MTTTVNNPNGLAIDPASGRIYWANSNTIVYANFDGSGGGTLPTTGATFSSPTGLAIDSADGRIYWANQSAGSISFANLNGGGGRDLHIVGATVAAPSGVAVDPVAGRIYWANRTANKISYASLNGSGGADLAVGTATVNGPIGVAVDPGTGTIYWANWGGGKISYARLDGSGGGDLTTTGATVSFPMGVAVDPAAGRIYWANRDASNPSTISFANLNGSGGGDLTTTGATVNSPVFPELLEAPAALGVPTISGGGTVGSMLSCSTGTWASDLPSAFLLRAPASFQYQWSLNGMDLGGATTNSLTATSAGTYRCRVTGTNHVGTATETSAADTVASAATPGGTAPPAPPGTAPSNRFTIGSLRGIRLTVTVLSAGTVRVRLNRPRSRQLVFLKPVSARGGPGKVTVALKLTAKARRILARKHRLRIKAVVTFTPTGGVATSKTVTLTLKSAPRR